MSSLCIIMIPVIFALLDMDSKDLRGLNRFEFKIESAEIATLFTRFKQKPPWPWLGITTATGILVIALLIGQIFHATINRIAKVEDDYHEMMVLKKRAEDADVAKSQVYMIFLFSLNTFIQHLL